MDKISESGGFLKKTSDGRWQDIGKFLTNYHSVGHIAMYMLIYMLRSKLIDLLDFVHTGPVQSREKVGHYFRDSMSLVKSNKVGTDRTKLSFEAQNAIFSTLRLSHSAAVHSSSPSSSNTIATVPTNTFSSTMIPSKAAKNHADNNAEAVRYSFRETEDPTTTSTASTAMTTPNTQQAEDEYEMELLDVDALMSSTTAKPSDLPRDENGEDEIMSDARWFHVLSNSSTIF